MKDCILFVHGTYRSQDLAFYKKLCRAKFKIAVDGGYNFFKKTGLVPDLIIGDMDSAFSLPDLPSKTTLLTFPTRKDKTDSQLAVEYCIEQGAKSIDLVMPSVGQTDHFVANLLLSTLRAVSAWAGAGGRFRVLNRAYEVHYLNDGRVTLTNCAGHTVSVLPICRQIVLNCRGTDYDVRDARIARGHTRALRNRISDRKAVFAVKGEALVWHLLD